MKTDSEANLGNATVRWLKSFFTSGATHSLPDKANHVVAPSENTPSAPRKNKKVLVVDDDPVFLKAASMRLESEGYDVVTASEGSDAIQIARQTIPDVLVLDVELTRDVAGVPWDGFSVIEWLRRFDDLKSIPVVMTSGSDPAKYTKKAFVAGASAFFHKRMAPSMLITLVSRSLRHPGLVTPGVNANFQI